MTFKSLNDLNQVYLKECLQCSTDIHGYNTRSAKGEKLFASQKSKAWQIGSFKARAIRIWNALLASITMLESLHIYIYIYIYIYIDFFIHNHDLR